MDSTARRNRMATDKQRLDDLEADQKRMRDELHVRDVMVNARKLLMRMFDEYEGEVLHQFIEEHADISAGGTVQDFIRFAVDDDTVRLADPSPPTD